jgi:hypothetical protein
VLYTHYHCLILLNYVAEKMKIIHSCEMQSVVYADANRQPSKRRKRKAPASGSNISNNATAAGGGTSMAGRIKRSPDPQNFNPILGVSKYLT